MKRGNEDQRRLSWQWLVASVYWRSISAAARAMQVAGVPRSATHWLLERRDLPSSSLLAIITLCCLS
ncbi:hypothetical protein B5X24_HaOG204594 [Helicoverpa armigera]|nr:hypothetical protein B5X24_HaOG204594 [Helicoverpa armigera]